jgi:RHS repeat-associated protein
VDVRTDADKAAVTGQAQSSVASGELPGEFLYFFHPDHLGSTAYVTDDKGAVYEHLQYFPFGETWVQEGQPSQRIPYLFTSKELDEETGLYYFGARYYDARTSLWVSADPAFATYMNRLNDGRALRSHQLALYSYVGNKPTLLTDPDGNAEFYSQSGAYLGSADPNDPMVYVSVPTIGGDSVALQLPTTIADFHIAAQTAYGESGGTSARGHQAVVNTMANRAAARGETISGAALAAEATRTRTTKSGTTVPEFAGRTNAAAQNYASIRKHSNIAKAKTARAGVISTLLGGEDITGGALFFEARSELEQKGQGAFESAVGSSLVPTGVEEGGNVYFKKAPNTEDIP